MSKKGHYQKVRRPTGLEVYNDAANILEELLEKRIDKSVKNNARPRRNKTEPNKPRDIVERRTSVDITVARCETMPSRYRESIDESVKRPEDPEVAAQLKKLKKRAAVRDIESDYSSANETEAESDADDASYIKNRKKKSIFKRAKENLIRSFRRDQKNGFGQQLEKDKDVSSISSSSFKKKSKKQKEEKNSLVTERKRSVKGHLNKDKSIDYTEVVDYHCTDPSKKTDTFSHKIRSGSMSRNSLMDVIRKPFNFRKSLHKKDKDSGGADEKSRVHFENKVKSLSLKEDGTSTSPHSTSSPQHESTTPSPPLPGQRVQNGDLDVTAGRKDGTLSSNTSITNYPNSDYTNSMGSLTFPVPASRQPIILDSPGEDIKFIDDDEKEKRKSLIKYHGSEGLLSLQWLADQTAYAKAFDFAIDEHSVSTRRPDGQFEKTTVVTSTRTVVLPELQEEKELDTPDGSLEDDENECPIKEQLYGKIAQKLIEMADTYGTNTSDTERKSLEEEAKAITDAPLTDLEKEIIACLRSGGEKYGKKMEDQLDALKQAAAEEAYDRFRTTIDSSMGHELSWNTLALLFYATKGVVSAVGKSSKAAGQAKEFTLKYISDTFVSWIMEQGGFDSMLSAAETDPELD